MRITKRCDLAIRALMYSAVNDGSIVTRHAIATACDASENHLGQVIHQLARSGLMETVRGRGGGVRLARRPREITLGQVFRLFEAQGATGCLADGDGTCRLAGACLVKPALDAAMAAFLAQLDLVTLEALVRGNTRLHALISGQTIGCQPRVSAAE